MGRLQLLAAFLLLFSAASIAVYSSSTDLSFQGNFRALTVPAVNVSASGGYVYLTMSWYGGLQPYDAKVYFGQSPTCAFDTVLFNDTNDIILPPNPMGYNPNQQYDNWVWIDSAYDANAPQYDGYYCVTINDSTGNESWTSYGIYLNMSQYSAPTTTSISTTSSIQPTSTIPLTPTVSTSTVDYQVPSNQATCGCVCSGTCVYPVNGTPSSGRNSSATPFQTSTVPGPTICNLPNIPVWCAWISTPNSTAPCAGHVSCTSQSTGPETSSAPTIEARIISGIRAIIISLLRFL